MSLCIDTPYSTSKEYWDNYYTKIKSETTLKTPSDFAKWIFSCVDLQRHYIVDLGCGNGRDALFFASQNSNVLALDYADTAIAANTTMAQRLNLTHNVSFRKFDASNQADQRTALGQVQTASQDILVYSRFFFHAIDEFVEDHALFFVRNCLLKEGSMAMFEFRTELDIHRAKATDAHYRRYINSADFITKVKEQFGLECMYHVEGTGLAVYGSDDAYVARLLFSNAKYTAAVRKKLCRVL